TAIAALGHASAPRPTIRTLLPEAAAVGTTVFVLGSGFGTRREDVAVWFGCHDGQVLGVRDGSVAVRVPDCGEERCTVSVVVGSRYSEPVAFAITDADSRSSAVRVTLTVGKNPVGVGEETT